MSNSYDVAMFQAALEKKTHLLPNGSRKVAAKNEHKLKTDMGSEVTLVETNSTEQKKESPGSDAPSSARFAYPWLTELQSRKQMSQQLELEKPCRGDLDYATFLTANCRCHSFHKIWLGNTPG